MNPDSSSPSPATPADGTSDAVRRQVVDVATELMRGAACAPGGAGLTADSSGQSAMNLYLALLTDRLPVFARALLTLRSRIGEGNVEENLIQAAQATIQFYSEILAAKVSVFTQPDQLVQLRRTLRSHGLGPQEAHERIAAYLSEELRLGRIGADVDCHACAQLLIGACVNYAFTKMLLDEVMPREVFVERAVRGLRLTA
jgi:hypothetical protein